jgi:hypothetical protein
MNRATCDDIKVATATAAERHGALDLVLQDVPAERRRNHIENLIAAEQAGSIDLGGLLIVAADGETRGAI